MSFTDSLFSLGGDLTGSVSDLGGKYLDFRLESEKNKATNTVQPAQTIQPALAQPDAARPTTGINANGETMVERPSGQQMKGLLDDKRVVYTGAGLLTVIGLALAYKLVK